MRNSLIITLIFFSVLTKISAACSAPSTPGVRICSPTVNATVVFGVSRQLSDEFPFIDFNSTPASGAQIVKVKAYDNNIKFFEGGDFESGATLSDERTSSLGNGMHHLVINAWDSAGNLYQGQVSFRVIGNGFPVFCSFLSDSGVNICSPPPGALLSTRVEVTATAMAKSGLSINAMKLYVDNIEQGKIFTDRIIQMPANTQTQGSHNIAVVAWDGAGNVYKSTRRAMSSYTWSWSICDPHGQDCHPGFGLNPMPALNSYVGSSFRLEVSIENNPQPITGMKAYIGNNQVASSNGPILIADLENVSSGTQVLTLQAWDVHGVLYRVQYNLNVNVPH